MSVISRGPVSRAGVLAATGAFTWRALLKIKHEPKQLVDVIAIPVVFTVLFTYIFGGALGGSPARYLTTLLPGTLVMGITSCTMYGGARLAQDVTTGVFDRFRTLPVWRGALVLGHLLADAGRYLLAATIVMALGIAIGYRPAGGVPGVVGGVALVVGFGLALSWLWAAVALLVRDPATVMSLGLAVLMPPSFASDIFVQPSTMPGWLQTFVRVNPISHVADAARDLMNHTGGTAAVTWSLLAVAAITLVFGPLTVGLYNRQS
ncbi:ABC transporter permease [Hamadaea tsunoensis]|uniref:ABC transporter permease n=1 Tax=Hamadaea tsunoensis TaxID=53368 RepID=UPI0004167038|nr:ABC transporter permease [Hamadaea tsunoensis]